MATKAAAQKQVGEFIPISQLQPSPTNPRKRFPQSSIDELAASIREQGIIEPVVVRKVTAGDDGISHEIICGERRYRAAQQAGLESLPCIVRDLTDEQVLDIQIHENLHREDVHPIDEAIGYKFLQEKLKCDTKEVAVRVGKPENYVINRLKLNNLIKEAQKDLESNKLPVGHAMEIAKFSPEIQKIILEDGVVYTWDDYVVTLKELCEEINSRFLHQLSRAEFDIKSTRLRSDGLACVKCPDRTGAAPGLFADYGVTKKDDHCLNPTCFEDKEIRHFDLMKEEAAASIGIEPEDLVVVDLTRYSRNDGVLGNGQVQQVGERAKKKAGEDVVQALSIAGPTKGQIINVKYHHKSTAISTSSSSGGTEKSPEEKEQFYKRKEEIWNANVGEVVRRRVLALASVKFAQVFSVTEGGDDFVAAMGARLWSRFHGSYDQLIETLEGQMDIKRGDLGLNQYTSSETAQKRIENFPDSVQKQILYLAIHGEKGWMNGYWKSQAEILRIAEQWKIDYREIDAKVRVELSSKKHMDVHKAYLAAVEAGDEKAKIPAIYSEKWKRD